MTFDGRTGMSLTWNDLGLVEKVSRNGKNLVNYSYLADGTKVSALDAEGNGLLYLGSLIYKKTGDSIELESAGFAGGRFVARETADGSVMVPMIHVSDHLGSVRAVIDGVSGEVVETNDYYPFGSRWDVATSLTDQTNRFRYNSKEEQFRFGTPYIDYGARQYDPTLGRWFAQDPLAEKYYGISPYAFCAGNPVKYLDPDGEFIGTATDVISVGVGVRNFIKNIRSGNVRGAIGDGVGVIVDVAAAAIPFVPGGVGLARNGAKAAKAFNALDNAADAVKGAETVLDAGTDAAKAADNVNSIIGGDNIHTQLGKQKHKEYNPGEGYIKEYKLPSGKRADAVNFETGDVRELKPNNKRAVKQSEKQVQAYKDELQKQFPEIDWSWHVDVYDKYFMREIDSRVREVLISHDFKLRKNSWYRQTEDFIQVLNFQKSYFSDLYYLNIGIDVNSSNMKGYKPEYMFSVKIRAEMIIPNRELILALDFTNELSESDRLCKINSLILESIIFLNSIRSWTAFRQAIDDVNHPIHKAAITASFRKLLAKH